MTLALCSLLMVGLLCSLLLLGKLPWVLRSVVGWLHAVRVRDSFHCSMLPSSVSQEGGAFPAPGSVSLAVTEFASKDFLALHGDAEVKYLVGAFFCLEGENWLCRGMGNPWGSGVRVLEGMGMGLDLEAPVTLDN
ncbi:hypothetical protein F4604DRAFT_1682499 [Suillus subluteus]|nr:hypothetical protein F4604DRAFT_1682499 [Suillus subluteus]